MHFSSRYVSHETHVHVFQYLCKQEESVLLPVIIIKCLIMVFPAARGHVPIESSLFGAVHILPLPQVFVVCQSADELNLSHVALVTYGKNVFFVTGGLQTTFSGLRDT